MKISKRQSNGYIWISLIIIAIASLMPGEGGRQTYGLSRESAGQLTNCQYITESTVKTYTDQGMKCALFLEATDQYGIYRDEKQITLLQSKTTYSGRICELKCYTCATELSPFGQQICTSPDSLTEVTSGTNEGGATGGTSSDPGPSTVTITGEAPSGTVDYNNGDDWVSSKITIKNPTSDAISGIVSLEIDTEEEIASRSGFGQSFNCESKEDIQKTFTINPGTMESTTLTSTNLPKGNYIINVLSVNRCCKYGCDPVDPFEWGDLENKITLNLPGKYVPTYTCGNNGGQCKSSGDQSDLLSIGTCPTGESCYKEPDAGTLLGFNFSSISDWWNDRIGWQKIAIVLGGFFVVSLLFFVKDRQQV